MSFLQKTGISLSIFVLFVILAQKKCYYGDAFKFNNYLTEIPTAIPKEATQKLFSLSLSAWSGEGTVLALVTYIAYFFNITYHTSFVYFDAFWGATFTFIWLSCIESSIKHKIWRTTLIIMGLSAPFLLIFMGHIEIYAPIITINLLWVFITLQYIKKQKRYLLILAIFTWLIAVKLHTTAILGVFGFILLIIQKQLNYSLSWKQIGIYFISPIYMVGGILYFFYFKDYIDDRSLQKTVLAYDHLFLPIISPNPPLDNYNLLSFHHIFDFVSVIFLWSPLAVFTIAYVIISFKKIIDWNTIEIKIISTTLLFYVSLFFMINPLLSLPIDWDLFSIPAPFLLAFTLILVSQVQHKKENKRLIGISLFFVCLNIPFFMIHQSKKQISLKLASTSNYIYHTYYEWTAQTFENALVIANGSLDENIVKREEFLNTLAPYAQKNIDYEYTSILNTQGKAYLKYKNNPKKALKYFKKAYRYSKSMNTQLLAVEAYFKLKDYQNAYLITEELITKKFPSEKKALTMAIHISLAADNYKNALDLSTVYLKKYNTPLIKEIHQRITLNRDLKTLKNIFKSNDK